MNFIETLNLLCSEKNINISKMSSDINISSGAVSNWKNRGTVPSGDILLKIASYFDVSVDYLLNSSTYESKATPSEQPLTEKQALFLSHLNGLSEEDANKLIDYAELLKKANNQ